MDTIEFFSQYSDNYEEFSQKINSLFRLNDIDFKLNNRKIVNLYSQQITKNTTNTIQESGLKELLQTATKYFMKKTIFQLLQKNFGMRLKD